MDTDVLPAYAGMILQGLTGLDEPGRAPRVCGDDPPTTWGTPTGVPVLPAYAGMIPERSSTPSPPAGAPRVCGDDPARTDSKRKISPCSPRMRG